MMLFEVDNLKVDFAVDHTVLQAVRGVSFTLEGKEILGIVGESGSGKSVTALALIGLLADNAIIRSGEIKFKGKPILQMDKEELRKFRGKEVGIIFQEPGRSFDPIYSIGNTFKETMLAHYPDLSDKEIEEKTIALLKEVNIPNPYERLKNFPHQFSGGMLQRIMIAISLVSNPAVLIADEPTTALDATIQAQIIELLLQLNEKRGLSIIFISHNLALIKSISQKIIVLYGGIVLEEGNTRDVLTNPIHPYTKALLASLPVFGAHYKEHKLQTIPGVVPNPLKPEPGCPFAPRCSYVLEECRQAVPDLRFAGHLHRCLRAPLPDSY